MKSSAFAVAGVLSLALVASITDARKDPGEYWQGVVKNEPFPEGIQALLENNCHTVSRDEFEPRPNLSAYNDDAKLKKENKSFSANFERRPNLSAYNDDDVGVKREKALDKSFEPRPNLSAYQD